MRLSDFKELCEKVKAVDELEKLATLQNVVDERIKEICTGGSEDDEDEDDDDGSPDYL